jgi:hypothetical protein
MVFVVGFVDYSSLFGPLRLFSKESKAHFDTVHSYFVTSKPQIEFSRVEAAMEEIKKIFTQYEQNTISKQDTDHLFQFAERTVSYSSHDPARKSEIEKVASAVIETTFLNTIINKLILSLTPSPLPTSVQEKTMIIAWVKFGSHFQHLTSPSFTESFRGVNNLIAKLYTPQEIENDPYLKTITELSSQIISIKVKKPPKKYPEQLDFINDLSSWFLKCYMVEPLCAEVLRPNAIDGIAEHFKTNFSLISENIFSRTARPLTPFEKRLIFKLITSFSKFFKCLQTTLQTNIEINSPAFTELFSQNLCKRPYDRKQAYEEIYVKITNLLNFFIFDKGVLQPATDKIFVLLLATALINLVKCMVNPEVAPFIIEQILLRGIPHFEHAYSVKSNDPKFATAIGRECSHICELFFSLGAKGTKMQLVTTGLNLWLRMNERQIGTTIHDILNQVTSRELILEPFRIASTVLFAEAGDGKIPIFRNHLNQKSDAKQSYCESTKTRFLDDLYPSIILLIERFNSTGAGFLKGESTKAYCTALGEKIWEISQNSDLMLLLIFSIFNSIEDAIEDEKLK